MAVNPVRSIQLTGLSIAGLEPGTTHLEVFEETADDETAGQLNVPLATPLFSIERVRTADGKPVVYSLDTFAATLLRGVEFDPKSLLSESVYQILETRFGYTIDYGVARILPAQAPASIARAATVWSR